MDPSEYAYSGKVERLDHLGRIDGELGDIEWRSVVTGCTDAAVV